MNSKFLLLFALIFIAACGVKSDPVAKSSNNYPTYDAKFVTPTPTPTADAKANQ